MGNLETLLVNKLGRVVEHQQPQTLSSSTDKETVVSDCLPANAGPG